MSANGQSTWAANPPYRPGAADFNNYALIDDQEDPPGDQTLPSAELFNEMAAIEADMAAVVPNLVLSVTGGGSPSINSFTCTPAAVRALPAASTFTVTRNGAGDVSITWPANTFPPALAQPVASLNTAQPGMAWLTISAVAIANGVRVTTASNGTLTDMNFTVQVF